jgi:hypothetical protein
MEKEGENIPLSSEDIAKIRKIFSEKRFEDFKIHHYYLREKYTGVLTRMPRHGIELSELKEMYNKKYLITKGFKRKTQNGYLYTLCYKESEHMFVKIIYILDTLHIFSAMRVYRKLDDAIEEKYTISINV